MVPRAEDGVGLLRSWPNARSRRVSEILSERDTPRPRYPYRHAIVPHLEPRPLSDDPADLTLVFLRRIDAKVDRVLEDLRDLPHRTASLERQVADIRTDINHLAHPVDRFDLRLERIERRLAIADTAAPV